VPAARTGPSIGRTDAEASTGTGPEPGASYEWGIAGAATTAGAHNDANGTPAASGACCGSPAGGVGPEADRAWDAIETSAVSEVSSGARGFPEAAKEARTALQASSSARKPPGAHAAPETVAESSTPEAAGGAIAASGPALENICGAASVTPAEAASRGPLGGLVF